MKQLSGALHPEGLVSALQWAVQPLVDDHAICNKLTSSMLTLRLVNIRQPGPGRRQEGLGLVMLPAMHPKTTMLFKSLTHDGLPTRRALQCKPKQGSPPSAEPS